jgi:ribosomal protein S18 acetylase RimI-like enzyme
MDPVVNRRREAPIRFATLTRRKAEAQAAAILSLGADQPWERWSVENLLASRPLKWKLSLLATCGRVPIGYAIASVQGGWVHLHHLVVGADWRARGIGAALLHRLALRTKRLAVRGLSLKVYESNEKALRFYHRLGFRVVGAARDSLLRMERGLDWTPGSPEAES